MDKKTLELLGFKPIVFTDNQKKYFENIRGETFDIVTYLPIDYVKDILDNYKSKVTRYIMIEHNKTDDLYNKETKGLKKEHIHIVAEFLGKRRASALCKMFNTTEILRVDTTEQYIGSILYLTHESKKAIAQGKVKYEKSKLISNDIQYFNDVLKRPRKDNPAMQIIDSILLGLPYREMVCTYGRDFVYHYKQYLEMAKIICNEDARLYNDEIKKLNGDLKNE